MKKQVSAITSLACDALNLPMSRSQIITAQKEDESLVKCFNSIVSPDKVSKEKVVYFVENDLLMRKWCSNTETDADWNVMYQIVIPCLSSVCTVSGA